MSTQMNNLSEHESCWALKLLVLLQEMAARNTNAVLQILANVDHLETDCRYPDAGLLFADKRWRAYYHCHETNSICPNEHGHFHLFTDIGDQTWAHVVGLSIDAEGQPLQWFMVNRWVTDGPWLDRKIFLDQLKYVSANNDECLAGNWLGILLQLYRDTLSDLLKRRDQQLNLTKGSLQDTLEDREIYALAAQEFDLQFMLEKHLLHNRATVPELMLNKEKVQQGV